MVNNQRIICGFLQKYEKHSKICASFLPYPSATFWIVLLNDSIASSAKRHGFFASINHTGDPACESYNQKQRP